MKGFEKYQERVKELAGGDLDKVKLAENLAELESDFEFVKDLNTQLSTKYQELLDCFPTVEELENLIDRVQGDAFFVYDPKRKKERLAKLTKFRSALLTLESNDPLAKPVKYEDLVKDTLPKEDQ